MAGVGAVATNRDFTGTDGEAAIPRAVEFHILARKREIGSSEKDRASLDGPLRGRLSAHGMHTGQTGWLCARQRLLRPDGCEKLAYPFFLHSL